MAALSDAQLWTVVRGQWGTGQDALKAFAIALAESGGDPTKTNTKNRNGTTDYGLFQINSVHADLLKSGNWQDPQTNANMAYQLYASKGNKFTDWVAYNTGSYARFLGRAQAAAQAGGAPLNNDPTNEGDTGAGTAPSPQDQAVANATSGSTWLRIGEFVAGGLLVLIVAISLIKNTSVAKAAMSVTPVGRVAKAVVGK